MLPNSTIKQKFAFVFLMLILGTIIAPAQIVNQSQPKWRFGGSGGVNFNYYRGTTQMLNNSRTVPTAFHKGHGIRPYVSILAEYRLNKNWGGMLNVAYDNRGGKFNGVTAPCNCPATLSTNISYITIEPSVRFALFRSGFYVFMGPTLNFNVSKAFSYTQKNQADTRGEWSNIRKGVFSVQAGAGLDIPISEPTSSKQMSLSPFASFETDFGHEPRSAESWSFYTVRVGLAFKFGMAKKSTPPAKKPTIPGKEVQFSVRAPKVVPSNRKIKETFALGNSVFFDQGLTEIPNRYTMLSKPQADSFKEEQLQLDQPNNLNAGRSSRQLAVYHNILNITGDRMRANPKSTINLTGASDKNPREGKMMAENIKAYLVSIFGIDGSRISTSGRDKPVIPSEQQGGTKELRLLREGDRRVDITSTSPELLMQVGGSISAFLKPVQISAIQEDPLDSHVLFNVIGASELLKSWSVEFTDELGIVQTFGPYSKDQASVSGKAILGNNSQANYKIKMQGETKTGVSVKKESSVSLMKREDPKQEGLRYSILFDFDKSNAIEAYAKFLTEVVTPLIPENGTVMIHGHTDIIGDETYNRTLSKERARGAQQIIEHALGKAGKKGIRFETYGFGKDIGMAPFENNLPEERYYNRTVIIDIISGK